MAKNFLDLMSDAMQSPGFQMGAGLFSAASNGEDIGSGLLAGSRVASQATQQQRQAAMFRKQQEDQQRQSQMWDSFSQSKPEWAKSLPPGVLDMAMGMGPEQGSALITQMMLKNADRDLDERRLAQTERYQNAQLQLERDRLETGRGPQFATIGHDAYGNPAYGFVDPRKGTVTPMAAPSGSGDAALAPEQNNQSLVGEDFLKTLDKPIADQVRALAEGRLPVPGSFALKSPYWQRMMSYVSQYDPSFDAINYNARAATRKDFTSGKSAANITSFNTALGHIEALDKSVDKLGNGRSPLVNSIRNTVRGQGDAEFQKNRATFDTAKNAVTEELARAFKGTSGTLSEVEEWAKRINSSESPEALHAVVKEAVKLLHSRITSVRDQYNRGMGTSKQIPELLSPEARAIYERLYGKGDNETPDDAQASDGGGWGYGGVAQ